jgi:hypothetical protein
MRPDLLPPAGCGGAKLRAEAPYLGGYTQS